MLLVKVLAFDDRIAYGILSIFAAEGRIPVVLSMSAD